MEILTAYGPHQKVQLVCKDPTRTVQSAKDECDINRILAKWQKTGVVTHVREGPESYGDLTGLPETYHESMNAVLSAQKAFDSLPSTVRKRFGNDPAVFLANIEVEENREFLEEYGILEKREPAAPAPDKADQAVPPGPPVEAGAGQDEGAPATT